MRVASLGIVGQLFFQVTSSRPRAGGCVVGECIERSLLWCDKGTRTFLSSRTYDWPRAPGGRLRLEQLLALEHRLRLLEGHSVPAISPVLDDGPGQAPGAGQRLCRKVRSTNITITHETRKWTIKHATLRVPGGSCCYGSSANARSSIFHGPPAQSFA